MGERVAFPGPPHEARNVDGVPTPRLLGDWLTRCDIETVAMESTGVYWIPLFELLSERGVEVRLVGPAAAEERAGPQD